jgi:PhzF family phenazine biosynthesis protein
MELFVVDAFANQIFGGNQAGVVLLEENESFPEVSIMKKIAAELKHSETAFVKAVNHNTFRIKYFTPKGEIDLCGHATISSFTVLRNEKKIGIGNYIASTLVGNLNIEVKPDFIWMEMGQGELIKQLTLEESSELYQAYGLCSQDRLEGLQPCIVNTGLSDILLPVNSKEKLDHAIQNRDVVIKISEKHNVVGVHMFYYASSQDATAYCRNFAPLYDIDEEAATGTSNGALTYYLFTTGHIHEKQESIFIQGESMGKPSFIHSKIIGRKVIYIGGDAVISIKGSLRL